MTKPRFVTQIRDILCTIGLPQHHFAGHSFRIGAATTAAAVGMEDSAIQMLAAGTVLHSFSISVHPKNA